MIPVSRGVRAALALWTLPLLGAAAGCLTACSPQGEVQLLTEPREGVFYTSWEEARQVAQRENKHILLDLWRPG
jgi:hypothetical protein